MTYHYTIRVLFGYDKVFIEFIRSSETFMQHVGLESFDGDAAVVSRWLLWAWRSIPLTAFALETCSTRLPCALASSSLI